MAQSWSLIVGVIGILFYFYHNKSQQSVEESMVLNGTYDYIIGNEYFLCYVQIILIYKTIIKLCKMTGNDKYKTACILECTVDKHCLICLCL